MPALAHLVGEDTASVVWRVRRLTQLASAGQTAPARPLYTSALAFWSSLCAFLFVMAFTATNSTVLWLMHRAMERAVSALN
jgi:hypothetical protein